MSELPGDTKERPQCVVMSFLVDESRAEESIKRLHKVFFSSERKPEPRASHYALCQSGGTWQ